MIDDPSLHWKLDEGSGFVATDEVGAHAGALQGGAAWVTPGRVGSSALRLLSDQSSMVAFTRLAMGLSHTVAAWVRFRDTGDGILVGGDLGDYALYFDQSAFYYSAGQSNFAGQDHGLSLPSDVWHHYAVSRNQETLQFYLDGQPLGPSRIIFNLLPSYDRVGCYTNGNFLANVDIDDLRMYSRPLSPSDITELVAYAEAPPEEDNDMAYRAGFFQAA